MLVHEQCMLKTKCGQRFWMEFKRIEEFQSRCGDTIMQERVEVSGAVWTRLDHSRPLSYYSQVHQVCTPLPRCLQANKLLLHGHHHECMVGMSVDVGKISYIIGIRWNSNYRGTRCKILSASINSRPFSLISLLVMVWFSQYPTRCTMRWSSMYPCCLYVLTPLY